MREPVRQHHSLVRMTKEVVSGEWVARVFVRELVPGCYTPGDVVVRKNDVGSVLGRKQNI